MILQWNNTTKKLTLDGTEYSLANHYTLESVLRAFSSGGILEEANGISLSLRRGGSVAEIDIDSNNQITFNGETYNSSQAITKEKLIRILSGGGAIPLTDDKYLINYVLDSGEPPANPEIGVVEITENFLTNAETNLRLGGIGSGEWTTLQKAYILDPAKDTIVKFSTKKYWVTGQQYYIMCLNNFGTSDSLTNTKTWWNLVIVQAKVDGTLEVQTSGLRIGKNDVGFDNYQGMLQNKATVISNIINYMFGTLTFDSNIRIYEQGGQDPITDFTVQNVYYKQPSGATPTNELTFSELVTRASETETEINGKVATKIALNNRENIGTSSTRGTYYNSGTDWRDLFAITNSYLTEDLEQDMFNYLIDNLGTKYVIKVIFGDNRTGGTVSRISSAYDITELDKEYVFEYERSNEAWNYDLTIEIRSSDRKAKFKIDHGAKATDRQRHGTSYGAIRGLWFERI